MNIVLTKNLIVEEDIDFGEAVVSQTRNNITYSDLNQVRTIRPINSLAEMDQLDPLKFPKLALYIANSITFYAYDVNQGDYVEIITSENPFPSATYSSSISQLTSVYDQAIEDSSIYLSQITSDLSSLFYPSLILTKSVTLVGNNSRAYDSTFEGEFTFSSDSITLERLQFENIKIVENFLTNSTLTTVINNFYCLNVEFTSSEYRSLNLQSVKNGYIKNSILDFYPRGGQTILSTNNIFFDNVTVNQFPNFAKNGSVVILDSDYFIHIDSVWIQSTSLLSNITTKSNISSATLLANLTTRKNSADRKVVSDIENNILLLNYHALVIIDAENPLRISEIKQIFDGHEFILISLHADTTIDHNEYIKLKNSVSRILSHDEAVRFIVYDNKCIEV